MSEERKHAILSASSAHRWLYCTPSARLEEKIPDEGSTYAEEGTLAHSLAELELRKRFEKLPIATYKKRLKEIQGNPLYSPDMPEHVGIYVDLVEERYNQAKADCSDAILHIEVRVDFSEYVPDGFGTADTVIIADKTLEVIDFKYGTGVPVEAEGNDQMMLYGLGAYGEYSMFYDIQIVRMTICQPRLDSITTAEIMVDDLLAWATDIVQPRATLAYKGEGEFRPSVKACLFCRARYTCRARYEDALEIAKYEFRDPELLSAEEIAEILGLLDKYNKWAKDVSDYAHDQAVNHGVTYPGWKLVEGRSVRQYTDDLAVAQQLTAAGYDEALIYERKLLGITAMEKLLGKKKFAELLNDLVIKPPGKPTLVPESDKRPAINSIAQAIEDFKEEI